MQMCTALIDEFKVGEIMVCANTVDDVMLCVLRRAISLLIFAGVLKDFLNA